MIVFPSPPLRYVCVKYDHGYISSVVLSSLMTVNRSEAPEFIPGFSGVRVAQSLVFCVMYCRSLFVLFLLAIVLSVLFFYLRLLITPLISSNFFFNHGIVPRVTLCMLYKIQYNLIDINKDLYIRHNDSRTRGQHRLFQERTNNETYRNSFFQRTVRDWNLLPTSTVAAATIEEFRANLMVSPASC